MSQMPGQMPGQTPGQTSGSGWISPGSGPQPGPWGSLPGYAGVPPADLRPGIIPLRPLGLGEIYDGAFHAVRSNPGAMVGASAVVVAVMTAIQLAVQAWMFGSLGTFFEALGLDATGDPEAGPPAIDTEGLASALGTLGAGTAATQIVSVIALSVLTALVTVVVGSAVLGQRTAGSELWRRVRSRLLPLIGLTLLVGLLVGLAALAALAPGLLLLFVSPIAGALVLLLGIAGALAVWLWLDTRWAMAGPALLLEEQRVVASMRRAWRLTSRGFWRVLGIRLLTLVIVLVTMAVVQAPFSLVAGVLFAPPADAADPFTLEQTLPQLVIGGIGTAIAATIVYPFAAAVTALLYVDQRMRLEGLDVELARAAAETP